MSLLYPALSLHTLGNLRLADSKVNSNILHADKSDQICTMTTMGNKTGLEISVKELNSITNVD